MAPTLYDDGTHAGTTILQAVQKKIFASDGEGFFYNPKYDQMVAGFGIWSNRSSWKATVTSGTFLANEGVTANNGAKGYLLATIDANLFIDFFSGSWGFAASIIGNTSGATGNIDSVSVQSYSVGTKVIWGGYSMDKYIPEMSEVQPMCLI